MRLVYPILTNRMQKEANTPKDRFLNPDKNQVRIVKNIGYNA
ncbi:hypothetical protein LX73_2576 [Fodinibius salinus]|uniref:Uncharacterized protein n=1 Tax=Fodinibius salinus TaxID=860790 RepID=A0A5D3YHL7_9BACT|nr:hypothetical protein LX73_2576 [Fodinibius salinus]